MNSPSSCSWSCAPAPRRRSRAPARPRRTRRLRRGTAHHDRPDRRLEAADRARSKPETEDPDLRQGLHSRPVRAGLHEHLEILDAILARDADRAGEAMRRHLDNVREAILTHIHRLY
ncbi:MAG: FCD domain-containing protein [Alphaproteobacteria bacterium]|nr:FCD domain-containing protein [Alphaproteobacteria bacterium]